MAKHQRCKSIPAGSGRWDWEGKRRMAENTPVLMIVNLSAFSLELSYFPSEQHWLGLLMAWEGRSPCRARS